MKKKLWSNLSCEEIACTNFQYILAILFCFVYVVGQAQNLKPEATEVWEPIPPIVNPGEESKAIPPSDAIILFNGKNTDAFSSWDGKEVGWKVEGGALKIVKGSGDIMTKDSFGDCQLHIEFMTSNTGKKGQLNGNSGVFLQGRYEVQILNSYEQQTYVNGQAGSIYKQYPPLVNASKAPGEWQVYDIIFTAPKWNENGSRKSPGYITVLHNGILIQNHVEIQGTTEYIGPPKNIAHGDGPLKLQDHGDPNWYRNIWIRRL